MDKDTFGRDINPLKNWKKYKSLDEMPGDVRMQLESELRQLKDTPFVGRLFNGDQLDPAKMNEFMNNGKTTKSIALLVAGIFLLTGGIIFAIFSIIQSSEETFELSSDPTHFDPIASYEEVRSQVGSDSQLLSFDARYIRPDGTMDLTADYNPSTNYKFFVELAEAPADAPPIGAGGNAEGKWYQEITAEVYEPGQWRHVTSIGGGVSTEYSYQNKGIDLDRGIPTGRIYADIAPAPACKLKDLWDIAIKNGAPENAVASITYNNSGFSFSISDARFFMDFTPDCKLKE